jgi:hypothetical protein
LNSEFVENQYTAIIKIRVYLKYSNCEFFDILFRENIINQLITLISIPIK